MNWIRILSFFVLLISTNCDLNDGHNLAGSYRLRVPLRLFTISEGKLSIGLCYLHQFEMELLPNNQIKFSWPQSYQKKGCTYYYDKQYKYLFVSINSYKLDGKRLIFYINGEYAALAHRSETSTSLYGQWKLEVRNLSMWNLINKITFKGCNYNYFVYDISEEDESGEKQIKIQFLGHTRMHCSGDNDQIFQQALTRAKTIKIQLDSFELYDSVGILLAIGGPYLK